MTSRAFAGLVPYAHFGVELPAGGVCENSPRGIRVVSLPDFARGGTTRVHNPDATPEERDRAVERAMSRIGERRYSLTSNNCEHFANWCATGVAVSRQVIAVSQQLIATIRTLAQMMITAVISCVAVSVVKAALAE